MLLDRLTDDQGLFVFACACRMLGVKKKDAIKGVTPLRELPEPSGLILTSIRAETGLLIGRKQEEALLDGEFGQLNRFMLGADDAAISDADAVTKFRALFPEPQGERILLFELADVAATILAQGSKVELGGMSNEEDIIKLIEEELSKSLGSKNPDDLKFVLDFVGRGVGAGDPKELEGMISPFVEASAGIIAASARAVGIVENLPEGSVEAVKSSEGEGSSQEGRGSTDSGSSPDPTPGKQPS